MPVITAIAMLKSEWPLTGFNLTNYFSRLVLWKFDYSFSGIAFFEFVYHRLCIHNQELYAQEREGRQPRTKF